MNSMYHRRSCRRCLFFLAAATLLQAQTDVKPGSITYDEIAYPYPVAYLPLTLYGQDVPMAYVDIPPAGAPNGRTVVLFHGMNFGRSSKPIIPYNFNDMAANVRKLLAALGVNRATIRGYFPPLAKHIADSIPGAQLVLFPNVGHVPHIQIPETFNKELLKFLTQ